MNVKVFYLKSVVNETRFTVQYNFRECKCGLNKSVYNSKKKLNSDECQCEPFKNQMIGVLAKNNYMWNPICDYILYVESCIESYM